MKNNKGQVTLEFIFSFAFALSFSLFFIYFAFNYTVGYLAHYATFSASRSFLTAESGSANFRDYSYAIGKGEEEFAKFNLKNFGAKFDQVSFNTIDGSDSIPYEFVGAYLLFDPPFKIGQDSEKRDLLSESFLGKEPSRAQCRCQLKKIMGFSCGQAIINEDVTLYDNGC